MAETGGRRGKAFPRGVLDMTIPGGPGGKEIVHRLKMLDPGIKVWPPVATPATT